MHARIILTRFKKIMVDVLVYLRDSTEDEKEVVEIRAMYCEYYLIEEVIFENRDAAYDFIRNYTVKMAKSFVDRQIYFGVIPQENL